MLRLPSDLHNPAQEAIEEGHVPYSRPPPDDRRLPELLDRYTACRLPRGRGCATASRSIESIGAIGPDSALRRQP
jgi:hypothetical protein